MHDSRAVRHRDGVRDLRRVIDCAIDGQPRRRYQLSEGRPVHELHDDEVHTRVMLDAVDGDDVRVAQR